MANTNITDPGTDLEDLLREFDHVAEDLQTPSGGGSSANKPLVGEGTRPAPRDHGVSGGEDSDYCSKASLGNGLNASRDELRDAAGAAQTPKARLGDTVDLQSFIDSLDRELSEM